ncbi:TonB-dependent receptor, partial [Campylobacter lari]|nr:TonB-dependent receptor [Campylobacter lari]
DKQSHSVFALDSHQFNDIFSISGGARYEYSLYDTHRNYTNKMIIFGMEQPSNPELFDADDTSNNFAFEITPNFKYSDT